MGRAKGRPEHHAASERSRERVDGRHFYHRFFGEVGKYRRGRAREQGLSGAWWTIESDIVTACGGNDKAALRTCLPADLIERGIVLEYASSQGFSCRGFVAGVLQHRKHVLKRRNGMYRQPGDERCLIEIVFRNVQICEASIVRRVCYREGAQNGAERAVERELTRE